jgi:hypothetical protein
MSTFEGKGEMERSSASPDRKRWGNAKRAKRDDGPMLISPPLSIPSCLSLTEMP